MTDPGISQPSAPKAPSLSDHHSDDREVLHQNSPLIQLDTDVTDDLESESGRSSRAQERSYADPATRSRERTQRRLRRVIRMPRPPNYRPLVGDPPSTDDSEDSDLDVRYRDHLLRATEPVLPLLQGLFRPELLDQEMINNLLYALTKRLKPGRLAKTVTRVERKERHRKLGDTYRDVFTKAKLRVARLGLSEKDFQTRLTSLKKDHAYKRFREKSPEFHAFLIDFADFVTHNKLSEEQAVRALLSFLLPPVRDVTQNLIDVQGLKRTFQWLVDTRAVRATASNRLDAFYNWRPDYSKPAASLDDLYEITVLAYPTEDIDEKFQEAALGRVSQDIRNAFRRDKLAAGFAEEERLRNSQFTELLKKLMTHHKISKPKVHEIEASASQPPALIPPPAPAASAGPDPGLQNIEAMLARLTTKLESQSPTPGSGNTGTKPKDRRSQGQGKSQVSKKNDSDSRHSAPNAQFDLSQILAAFQASSSQQGGQTSNNLQPPNQPKPSGSDQRPSNSRENNGRNSGPRTHLYCGSQRYAIIHDPNELLRAQQTAAVADLNANLVEEGKGNYPYLRQGQHFVPLRRTVRMNDDMMHIFLKNAAGQVVQNPRVTGLFRNACAACGIVADHRMGSLRCPLQGAQSTWEPCKKCRMGFHSSSQCRISPDYQSKN